MLLLGALTTGHKIGLAIVAAIFIAFALACSFLVTRRRPDFPGEKGFGVFALVSVVLLAAMLTAVTVFGRESSEANAQTEAGQQGSAAGAHTIKVSESEFKIVLPPTKTATAGKYSFVVRNVGKIPHDLAIQGGNVSGPSKTPTIAPGKSATLTVSLEKGNYTLYCSIPGHKAAGMVAKFPVG